MLWSCDQWRHVTVNGPVNGQGHDLKIFEAQYFGKRARYRVGVNGLHTSIPTVDIMVTRLMTSRDPKRSRSWNIWGLVSRKPCECWCVNGPPIANRRAFFKQNLSLHKRAPKARGSRRRRRRRSGVRGGGVPLLIRLGGLGSVVSSPSGVRGGAPAANNKFAEFYRATSRLWLTDKRDFVPLV